MDKQSLLALQFFLTHFCFQIFLILKDAWQSLDNYQIQQQKFGRKIDLWNAKPGAGWIWGDNGSCPPKQSRFSWQNGNHGVRCQNSRWLVCKKLVWWGCHKFDIPTFLCSLSFAIDKFLAIIRTVSLTCNLSQNAGTNKSCEDSIIRYQMAGCCLSTQVHPPCYPFSFNACTKWVQM